MREAGRATVMDALPFTPPDVAVIFALPRRTAVTNPFVFTVATDVSLLVQANVAPDISSPLVS